MKTKTFTRFLAILSFIFFFSCEEDEIDSVVEEQTIESPTLLLGAIEDFPGLSTLLKTEIDDKKLLLQKSAPGNNEFYDFHVVEDVVSQISWDEDFHYTFPIIRENSQEESYENLIISNKEGFEPEAYIVQYFLEEGYWEALANDQNTPFRGNAKIIPLDISTIQLSKSRSGCTRTITVVKCRYVGHNPIPGEDPDTAGPGCTETYTETVTIAADCSANAGTIIDINLLGGGNGTSDESSDNNLPDPGNIEDSSIFLDPMVQGRRLTSLLGINSFSDSWKWIFDSANSFKVLRLLSFVEANGGSEEAKEFAREAIGLLRTGTTQQKEFVNTLLSNNLEQATNLLLEGVEYIQPNCFPEPCPEDQIAEAVVELSVSIVNGAYDGVLNLFQLWLKGVVSNEKIGKQVRSFMSDMGYEVPTDVDNKTLAELFKIRVRNREFVVEPIEDELKEDMIELVVSIFDITTLVSPGKGGSGYLFVKAGSNRITKAQIRAYLKALKDSYFRPIGPMLNKRIGHTFQKHGMHNTHFLQNSAKNTTIPSGQWLNEIEAEKFISRHLNQLQNGARDIPIPSNIQNIGRVFRNGDGVILNPTHIRLVPSGNGVKTAYPINSTTESLRTLGTYVD